MRSTMRKVIAWILVFMLMSADVCAIAATLELPNALKIIAEEAFYGATSIDEVVVHDQVTEIHSKAFADSSIAKINLPDSIEYIEDDAFDGCDELIASVVVGSYAYDWCSENSINITTDADPVQPGIFTYKIVNGTAVITGYNGTDKEVHIPTILGGKPVTGIGESAFEWNNLISSIQFPSTITHIGDGAFAYCEGLTSVQFSEGLTHIGYGAFSSCEGLTSVQFPEGLTHIDDYAFEDCPISKIELPNSLESIGEDAFMGNRFSTVTIPQNVSHIGTGAFCNSSLISINVSEDNDYYYSDNGVLFTKGDKKLASYPSGKTDANYTVPNGTSEIFDSAFKGASYLRTVILPDGLERIGDHAFDSMWSLTQVNIPEGVTYIGRNAFYETALRQIVLPSTLKTIGEGAFGCCWDLSDITIKEGVTDIGEAAFAGAGLTAVTIPSSVKTIGAEAFFSCESLASLTFSEGLTTIGDWAFQFCTMKNINLPASLESIGDTVFAGCNNLESVQVAPDNANYSTLDGVLFDKVQEKLIIYPPKKSHTHYNIPDTVKIIANGAFLLCNNLSSINIPDGVTTIEDAVFELPYLTTVRLPSSISSIGRYAFSNCENLTKVICNEGVTGIGSSAFDWDMNKKLVFHVVEGSAAHTWCINMNAPYSFHVWMDNAMLPGENVVKDDPFTFIGRINSVDIIKSFTATIYSSDGKTVIQRYTAKPNTASYNLGNAFNENIKLDGLEIGSYVYEVVASSNEETRTIVRKKFTISPPPLRVSYDLIIPSGGIPVGEEFWLNGTITANYPIDYFAAYVKTKDGKETNMMYSSMPQTYTYDISYANSNMLFELYPSGDYVLTIEIEANDERYVVINSPFSLEGDDSLVQRRYYFDYYIKRSSETNSPMYHLLQESIKMSKAIYNWDSGNGKAKSYLKMLGFEEDSVEEFDYKPIEHSVGHAFATKEISLNDGTRSQVFVVVCRGTIPSMKEWISDFRIVNSNEYHYGFNEATKRVKNNLVQYINTHLKSGIALSDCKILVTGHSRGAAVANILAGNYLPSMGFKKSNIHAYTFACPNVYRGTLPSYTYIRNYNIGGDLVARVPFKEWGYSRYGITNVYYNGNVIEGKKVIKNESMDEFCDKMKGTIKYQLAIYDWMVDWIQANGDNGDIGFDFVIAVEVLSKGIFNCFASQMDAFFSNGDDETYAEIISEIISYAATTHSSSTYLNWIDSLPK